MKRPDRPPSRLEFEIVFWGSLAVGFGLVGCIWMVGLMVWAP